MTGAIWEKLTKELYPTAGRDWPYNPPAHLWYQEWWIGYGKCDGGQPWHRTGNINNYQEGVIDGMLVDTMLVWRNYV